MKKALGCFTVLALVGVAVFGVTWYSMRREFNRAVEADTVGAYYEFVTKNKTNARCVEAAERASALVERGLQLPRWPAFLAALGENESGRPVPILMKYLDYPVADVRAGAAAGLLGLARGAAGETEKQLGDLNRVVKAAGEDSDPRVRLDLRCALWHLKKTERLEGVRESSPFVLEGFEAYKKVHEQQQK